MKSKATGIMGPHCVEDFGIEELLLPSIFLGVRLPLERRYAFLDDFSYTDREFARANELLGLRSFKDGQFVFHHQFAGHQCNIANLVGIFLPLRTCKDYEVRTQFQHMAGHFHPGHPLISRVYAKMWAPALRGIGPLEAAPTDVEEAFVRFSNVGQTYLWLKDRFEYVAEFSGLGNEELEAEAAAISSLVSVNLFDVRRTEFRENPDPTDLEKFSSLYDKSKKSRIISRTEPLHWGSLAEFSGWLGNEAWRVGEQDICAALIYQNSD